MPPEIAEKNTYIGQLDDMCSLGILVYKIFCVDFPFKGKDEKELYKSIKQENLVMLNILLNMLKKLLED